MCAHLFILMSYLEMYLCSKIPAAWCCLSFLFYIIFLRRKKNNLERIYSIYSIFVSDICTLTTYIIFCKQKNRHLHLCSTLNIHFICTNWMLGIAACINYVVTKLLNVLPGCFFCLNWTLNTSDCESTMN